MQNENYWNVSPIMMQRLEAGLLTPEQQKRLAYMLEQKQEKERLPKVIVIKTADIDDQSWAELIAAVSAWKNGRKNRERWEIDDS